MADSTFTTTTTTRTTATKRTLMDRIRGRTRRVIRSRITRSRNFHVTEAPAEPRMLMLDPGSGPRNEVHAMMKYLASDELEAERETQPGEYDAEKIKKLAEFLEKNMETLIEALEKEYEEDEELSPLTNEQIVALKAERVKKVKKLLSRLKHQGYKYLGTLTMRNVVLKRLIEAFSDRLEQMLLAGDQLQLHPTTPMPLLPASPPSSNELSKIFIIAEGALALVDQLPPQMQQQFLLDQQQYILTARTPAAPAKIYQTPPAESLSPILPTPVVLFHTELLLKFAAASLAFELTPPRYPRDGSLDRYGTPPPNWQTDAYFMEQRTVGVNACVVSRITPEQTQAFAKVGVKVADAESAFVWDYRQLLEVATERQPAAMLLTAFDAAQMAFIPQAVWICTSSTAEKAFAVKRDAGEVQWEFAKACLRTAEWTCHELGSHLGLCHLTSEVWDVLIHHTLPRQHPVFQLLLPHVFRTIPLNDDARATLVPKVIANKLSSLDADQCLAFTSRMIGQWDFQREYIPANLQARGVSGLPVEVYPFRKTALDTWNCIRSYVENVLSTLASAAGEKTIMQTDSLLRNWSREMQRNITNFPQLETMNNEALYEAITMMIYTSTHQHAAVNYFQAKYMSFLPAAPGHIRKFPRSVQGMTQKDLLNALPSYQTGMLQRSMVQMLSTDPEKKYTLSYMQRTPQARETSFAVEWQLIDNELSIMQGKLRNTLVPYSIDSVNQQNLAQSVLI